MEPRKKRVEEKRRETRGHLSTADADDAWVVTLTVTVHETFFNDLLNDVIHGDIRRSGDEDAWFADLDTSVG